MAGSFETTKSAIMDGVDKIGNQISKIDWRNEGMYADLLAQIFYYVNHATRVLAFAAVKSSIDDNGLHQIFLKGINEEKNHEVMAKKDLEELGYSLNDVHERTLTSCYYQTLYYQIDTAGPMALLGYFIPLEALGPLKISQFIPQVRSLYPNSVSFLEEHCLLDQKHYAEGLEFIKTRSNSELEIIRKTAELSCDIFANMLRELIASHKAKSKAA